MMLPKAGSHVHLWIKGYHPKLVLKLSLNLSLLLGFHKKACAGAEKRRRGELRLMLKRRTKHGEAKELMKRQ
jgi:hypothetical protein